MMMYFERFGSSHYQRWGGSRRRTRRYHLSLHIKKPPSGQGGHGDLSICSLRCMEIGILRGCILTECRLGVRGEAAVEVRTLNDIRAAHRRPKVLVDWGERELF